MTEPRTTESPGMDPYDPGNLNTDVGSPDADPPFENDLPEEQGPRRRLLIIVAAVVGAALLWMLFRSVPDEADGGSASDRARAEPVERLANASDPSWMQTLGPPAGTGAPNGAVVPPRFVPPRTGDGLYDPSEEGGEAQTPSPGRSDQPTGDGVAGADPDPRREAFQAALRSKPLQGAASFSAAEPAGDTARALSLPGFAEMEAAAVAEAGRRAVDPEASSTALHSGAAQRSSYHAGESAPAPAAAVPAVLIGRRPGASVTGRSAALPAGSVIEGQLHTAIHSDLPGSVVGMVTRDVLDPHQREVVIPRHSWLYGTYESDVVTGQSRLVVRWTSIRFPDGETFDLPALRAGEPTGASGLPGRVQNHYGRIFGHALLSSVIGAGSLAGERPAGSERPSAQSAVTEATAQQLLQTSSEVTRRNLSIKPTITVPRLTRFSIILERDLVFVRREP